MREMTKYIEYLNNERSTSFALLPDNMAVARGVVSVGNEEKTIRVEFTDRFPSDFPNIYLENPERFYPHVERDGKICLFDDSAILIKKDMPEIVLLDAFDRAIEILAIQPNSEEYYQEVVREFNAYWGNVNSLRVLTNISPLEKGAYLELSVVIAANKMIISDDIKQSEYLLTEKFKVSLEKKVVVPCTVIRMRNFAVPPIQNEYSWKWFRNFVLKNVTGTQKRHFKRFLSENVKIVNRFFLLLIPDKQRDIQIGFWIRYKGKQYRAMEKQIGCKVTPLVTIPIDYHYLLQRTGNSTDLKNKNILLLGCGSVGGYIAANLCQCGVCNLDIMDRDILSIDNVHRHILGFDTALKCRNKADLMKDYIERQYPYVDIDSLGFVERDVSVFLKNPKRFSNYDLIISALGEPSINLEINELLQANQLSIPFVVCFNEPYGIGGHVVAVNLGDGGCLRCMYTDDISNDLVSFRASWVAENQDFQKSLSGCAGSFVEYTALDSQQTAVMASRISIEILKGKCIKSTLFSWYGDSNELLSHGHILSEFYKRIAIEKQMGFIRKEFPRNERCPFCQKKRL